MKLTALILCFFISGTLVAQQSDEEFLADLIATTDLNKVDETIYIVSDGSISFVFPGDSIPDDVYHKAQTKLGTENYREILDELHACYLERMTEPAQPWNGTDPALQTWRQIRFVPVEGASRLFKKGSLVACIYKPIFSRNKDYALLSALLYDDDKNRDTRFENALFRQIDGQWEYLGEYSFYVSRAQANRLSN